MADTHLNFVEGTWVPTRSGATFENENPARRGSNLGWFQASAGEDIVRAVDAAAAAFPDWRQTTVPDRQARISAFLGLLEAERETLARIVTAENGKTLRESHAEIDSALIEGRHHLQQVSAFAGTATPGARGITTWVRYEPVGVVGVISPWNFPMNVMCRKTLPALLTGNTVVFKPASFTPWSGVYMAQLFERAGLPTGVFNCVTGQGSAIGRVLIGDPRVRAVSFTGSTSVGRTIQAAAAANLTRTQLELGGKNALIVLDDADLDAALEATMTAAFSNAGQWCTSTSRLLLHRTIAADFTTRLVHQCEAMTVGDGAEATTDMGPVAGATQYEDIAAAIGRAQDQGAQLLTGGRPDDGAPGYFIRPTVFDRVRPDMAIFQDEVFGPVLAVCPFASVDEAIDLANSSAYGLSSALFTRNLDAATRYIDGIEAGLAHVNVHTGYKEPALPFGGTKQSGAGPPENGRTGLEFFVEQKAVYVRTSPAG